MPLPFAFQLAIFLAGTPKLAALTVDGADLRTTSPIPMLVGMPSLKELSLRRREVDEATVSAILRVPATRKFLGVSDRRSSLAGVRMFHMIDKGQRMSQPSISTSMYHGSPVSKTLADRRLTSSHTSRPNLPHRNHIYDLLSLKLQDGRGMQQDEFRDSFPFSRLRNLKHLRVWTLGYGLTHRVRNRRYPAWSPVNVFSHLPATLERLQLGPFDVSLAVDELATGPLRLPFPPLPGAPRLEFVMAEEHIEPLGDLQNAIQAKRVRGTEKFMTQLRPARLTYVQHQAYLLGDRERRVGRRFAILFGRTVYTRTNAGHANRYTRDYDYGRIGPPVPCDPWHAAPQPGTEEAPPARSLVAKHYRPTDRWVDKVYERT
ncbi:hypothetical protein CLCR_03582 [Cladophialophora carrionii]|uniref:Uncharacterized protein n=1 Tax=Cladophialophora carrionii TaxID=86049 RepID=A0A1C1CG30_9EURO|nr:hypothetical protein CLCR_03582 [Cladophialophora carrionii]